jgi:hypothetical protein
MKTYVDDAYAISTTTTYADSFNFSIHGDNTAIFPWITVLTFIAASDDGKTLSECKG